MQPIEHYTRAIVDALLGAPDAERGGQRRYGQLAVNIAGPAVGEWWDQEAGEGGQLAALIRRRLNGQDAAAWLRSIGVQDARLDDLEDLARPEPPPWEDEEEGEEEDRVEVEERYEDEPAERQHYPSASATFKRADDAAGRARELFAKAKPLAEGTPAWRYLVECRSLPAEAVHAAAAELRVVPGPISGRKRHEIGLMSLLRGSDGQVSAFQITFLHGKTGQASPVEPKRRTYATREKGARDGLFHAGGMAGGQRCWLAEGYLEKPLALAALGLGPAYGWGGRKILGFANPAEAEVVIVPDRRPSDAKEAEDHDKDYRRGAARLASAGKAVWLARAPDCACCKDADDVLRAHGPEALRALLEEPERVAQAATGAPIVFRHTPLATARLYLERHWRGPEGELTLLSAGRTFWGRPRPGEDPPASARERRARASPARLMKQPTPVAGSWRGTQDWVPAAPWGSSYRSLYEDRPGGRHDDSVVALTKPPQTVEILNHRYRVACG